jgi:hypothetical protein
MKKYLKTLLASVAIIFASHAMAYDPGLIEEVCKKPKFTSFSLAEYSAPTKAEVPPESEFSFVVSNWIDPTTLKLTAKKKKLNFTITDKNSFFLVHAKLPAEYSGQFVRIDAIVNARLGCKGLDGWLVKVVAKPVEAAPAEAAPAEAKPAE